MINNSRIKLILCILFLLTPHLQLASAQVDDEKFLDTIELKTFLFFHENTDERGFTIESTAWHTGSSASSGFYLTSIPIAIERGWISYEEGYQCVNATLNSYYDNPDNPDDFYVESEHGFSPTGSTKRPETGTGWIASPQSILRYLCRVC